MIKEFNNETQAKAVANSLGLIITKYRGIYIVSNSKEEILAKYNLGYHQEEDIFYDKEVFREDKYGYLIIQDRDIVDASSVELPYNIKCCFFMFSGCTSLEAPPIIPESVTDCYRVFYRCISLKEPPHFSEHCNIVEALKGTPFERAKYDKRI